MCCKRVFTIKKEKEKTHSYVRKKHATVRRVERRRGKTKKRETRNREHVFFPSGAYALERAALFPPPRIIHPLRRPPPGSYGAAEGRMRDACHLVSSQSFTRAVRAHVRRYIFPISLIVVSVCTRSCASRESERCEFFRALMCVVSQSDFEI